MDKRCRDCGLTKPLNEFYPHPEMRDGHLNKCKDCVRGRVLKHRSHNLDRIREYDRKRHNTDKGRSRRAAYSRKMSIDPEWVEKQKIKKKEWIEKNRIKRAAHILAGNAIRSGLLVREPCFKCGSCVDVDAHHEDYMRPLDVVWLCGLCHGLRHQEINEEKRKK